MARELSFDSFSESPEISLSHYLTQPNIVPVAKQYPVQSSFTNFGSTTDPDFSFCHTVFLDGFTSAGDLFLNGKILPIGIKKTASSSNHVLRRQAASFDASYLTRQSIKDFPLERLKKPNNHFKEVDGDESSINQQSLSPYKRHSVSGKIHPVEIKRKNAFLPKPRLKLPLSAFLKFDNFDEPPPRLEPPPSALLKDDDFNKASASPRLKPLSAFLQDDDFPDDKRNGRSKELKKNRSVVDRIKGRRKLVSFRSVKRSTGGSSFSGDGGSLCPFLPFSRSYSAPNVQQVAMPEYSHRRKQNWQKFSLCLGSMKKGKERGKLKEKRKIS